MLMLDPEPIEISRGFVENSDIYIGMGSTEAPELVSVKEADDGWKVSWKFTARYMGHAPYSEVKLPALDEHEMLVYVKKTGEIARAICCGRYEVKKWRGER